MLKIVPILLILILADFILIGQTEIRILNSSFEFGGKKMIWSSCDFPGESPVDIQPGSFQVTLKAFDGIKYVGMVQRQTGTFEGISQLLERPLNSKSCYSMKMMIARDTNLTSLIKNGYIRYSFDKACFISVYGSNEVCGFGEFLGKSIPIYTQEWKLYEIPLISVHSWKYINIYVQHLGTIPYNGHVLIDKIENIQKLECQVTFDSISIIPSLEKLENSIPRNQGGVHFKPEDFNFKAYKNIFDSTGLKVKNDKIPEIEAMINDSKKDIQIIYLPIGYNKKVKKKQLISYFNKNHPGRIKKSWIRFYLPIDAIFMEDKIPLDGILVNFKGS